MKSARRLLERLEDRRSRKVVLLAHCILNENTRYLGGACRAGCIREILDSCMDAEVGIVQMPCPEQRAWGGVLKRHLLWLWGMKTRPFSTLLEALFPLMLLYTRWVYGRLARQVARQLQDYVESGCSVVAVVGIDGSPSCGVTRTMSLKRAFRELCSLDVETATSDDMNAIVQSCQADGSGLFVGLLRRELKKRGVNASFLGHDLMTELQGRTSNVDLHPVRPVSAVGS